MRNGLMNRFAIFALPLVLSSCLVGPDYVKPPTATPPTPEYKETSDINFRPATPRDSIDRGPWWNIYGDGNLEQLVAQVDVSNQNLKAQEAAYRQAVALVRQTQSSLYPTIGYTGAVNQNSSSGSRSTAGLQTAAAGNSVGQYASGGTLTWEIDVWGRIRRSIESNSAAAQASAADLAAARLSRDLSTPSAAITLPSFPINLFPGMPPVNVQITAESVTADGHLVWKGQPQGVSGFVDLVIDGIQVTGHADSSASSTGGDTFEAASSRPTVVITSVLGVMMAFRFGENRKNVWAALAFGALIPTLLVVIGYFKR